MNSEKYKDKSRKCYKKYLDGNATYKYTFSRSKMTLCCVSCFKRSENIMIHICIEGKSLAIIYNGVSQRRSLKH